MGRHFTKDEIQRMTTTDLVAIMASTVPTGEYAAEVVWAREELGFRKYPARKLLFTVTDIARWIGIQHAATGYDLGDLYDYDWDLSGDQWQRVCDIVASLTPQEYASTYPTEVAQARKEWACVDRDFRAEQRAERVAFSLE